MLKLNLTPNCSPSMYHNQSPRNKHLNQSPRQQLCLDHHLIQNPFPILMCSLSQIPNSSHSINSSQSPKHLN